jgi:hypothetical protein
MKAIAIAAAALGVAALSSWSPPANAATECFRETIARPAGNEVVQRCVTRRFVPRVPRTVTTTRTVTREYVATEPVTRSYDEEVYYGSSFPEPRYYERARYYDPLLGY